MFRHIMLVQIYFSDFALNKYKNCVYYVHFYYVVYSTFPDFLAIKSNICNQSLELDKSKLRSSKKEI